MKYFLLLISFSLAIVGCSIKESQIIYGKDACNFCKMNIVDKQHAAEIVTNKGKPYKYDAIECMVEELKSRDESKLALILITDYANPGNLIDAQSAYYLISKKIPSPMGANLSGFSSKEYAKQTAEQKSGEIYSWSELKGLF